MSLLILYPKGTDLESNHKLFYVNQTCNFITIVALVIYEHTTEMFQEFETRFIKDPTTIVASRTCLKDVR